MRSPRPLTALRRVLTAALPLAASIPFGAGAATLIEDVDGWTATATAAETHQQVESRRFQALLFGDDGRVIAVGSRAEVEAAAAALDEDVTRIDGSGRFLMPGLIDAHGHFTSLGADALRLDITGLRSLGETVERIRAYAADGEGWVTGGRWNQEHWPVSRFPTAADLDGVTDRPVWLRRVDGHSAWANQAAIDAAGVTAETPDPPGGQIIRDADGNPAGVFVDAAMRLIDDIVPPPSDDDVRAAIRASQDIMVSRGLTQVHDAGADAREIRLFQEMAANDALTVRLYVMLAGAPTLAQFDAPIDDPADFVDVRAVKLYSDGALGSRGAALFDDYSDDEGNRGLLFIEAADLAGIVDEAAAKGFQVGVHAIGTRANQIVLDAYERIAAQRPDTAGLRHRVEHSQILVPRDIGRFAELAVVASMQPTHQSSDMFMAEKRLGLDRLGGGYAWQQLLASGAVLALGSDFPVEPPDPVFGIHAAVTRQNREDEPAGGWRMQDAMTLEQTLRGFTLDAAWAAHQEDALGSLEPGKWADFVLFDESPFEIDPKNLWRMEVAETWVNGERRYQHERRNEE